VVCASLQRTTFQRTLEGRAAFRSRQQGQAEGFGVACLDLGCAVGSAPGRPLLRREGATLQHARAA